MDPILAIGSSLSPLQVGSLVNRDTKSIPYAPAISPTEKDPTPVGLDGESRAGRYPFPGHFCGTSHRPGLAGSANRT